MSSVNLSLGWFPYTNSSDANVSDHNSEALEDAASKSMQVAYRMRFVPYTAFAVACIFFNVLSIGAMLNIRGVKRSVHHTVLLNLAVCDMVGSVLLWMYYNSPYIFPRFEITTLGHCMFIVLVLVAPFILSLCNSFFTLLMLAVNQYMAICNPLWTATHVTKGKMRLCIVCAWLLAVVLATCPAFLMLAMNSAQNCTLYATEMAVHCLEICSYALAGLIVIIVGLYVRVYRKILLYRKDQAQIRRNSRGGNDSEGNFKAFITTAILTSTLVVFWLPYMVFHFISAHVEYDNMSDGVMNAKFYIVDFLPMLNFLTDPIVYGIRMKEIRGGYLQVFGRLCSSCRRDEKVDGNQRRSVRFTTLSTA